MHGTRELILEATALPVEERILIVDSLIRSLNKPEAETDKQWSVLAGKRLAELRAGRVSSIPAGQVFSRLKERFTR